MDYNELIENERLLARKVFGLPLDAPLEINNEGWTSRVYIYNRGEYVIKFPRTDEARKEYEKEVKASYLFQNEFVDLPKITEIGPDVAYIAYKGVIGRTLTAIERLESGISARIGRDLGSFISELHKKTPEGFNGFSTNDEIEDALDHFRSAEKFIMENFVREESSIVEKFVTKTVPEAMTKLGEKMVFSHGDLGYWNLILQDNGRIGVIDMGDADYYDESRDFVGMEDDIMLDTALNVYGDSETLRKKINLRQLLLPLMELPYYVSRGDKMNTEAVLRKIRMNITGMNSIMQYRHIK